MIKYDAIVIGFGKGGKTLAADLAKRGKSVAVVEQSDRMYGGICISIGCIPTKTLVHAAKLADPQDSWEKKQAYYSRAVAYKDEVTSFLRSRNYHNLADNPNITVYTGTSIMELEVLPKRLAIVGGGYIGLEFASMYASFGSQVTVLEGFSQLIAREDRTIPSCAISSSPTRA